MKKAAGRIFLLMLLAVLFGGIQGPLVSAAAGSGFIRSVTPDWGAADISPYVSIEVALDTAVPEDVLRDYVSLLDPAGKPVSGVRITRGSGTSFYVDADVPLVSGQTYRLMYMDVVPLTQFTTASRPQVSLAGYAQKYDSMRDVPLNKTFEIGFTQPMLPESVSPDTIWIEDDRGGRVDVKVSLSADKQAASIAPVADFSSGRMYFLKVSGGVRSEQGVGLGTPTVLPFRTVHQQQ
ncbi:Ig-like domain-containing protein [Brevibacillus sp. B_LB10_24]|uniref:Ig-like domain-containing protein n=1 Tax=Brevibacillus sp. B_LB10_24 TaxID=3380645 RepID=UPI0038BAD928